MTAAEIELLDQSFQHDRTRMGLKRFLPHTLFGRSLAIIITPVVLAQVVATWIFYDRHWDTITNRLSYAVAGEVAYILDEMEREPDRNGWPAIFRRVRHTMDLEMSFEEGARLTATRARLQGILQPILGHALEERIGMPFTIDTRGEDYELRFQLPDGVLRVLSPERRLFSPTTYIFILWMTGSAFGLVTIGLIFMRNQVRSIRRLAAAAESFGKGRDVPSFKPEGAREVRQAAAAFLLMKTRLQRQIGQRTAMLAGVSHDLRTPLTRMKLQLAMLGDGEEVEELKADVAEMEAMIEGYLAFARGDGAEPVTPTDLTKLVVEAVAAARRGGGEVSVDVGEGMVLPLRPNAFRRCLGNLLANARRHAGHAWVTISRSRHWIEIMVDDDGPGIPENMREDVFRPFHRLDTSRNAETGGAGLGLTIARDVARGLGGDVTLHDSPKGGLRALVRVPV